MGGDIVTADHIDCRRYELIGINDEREALVIHDIHSGMIHVYPVATNNVEATMEAIQHFRGTRRIKLLYSGGARELHAVCRQLGITHETSSPGQSQNNGIIERTNQEVEVGVAACLLQAGLPAQFWTFAAPCYCRLLNKAPWQGVSRWYKALGDEFAGQRLPFGCRAAYRPSPAKDLPRGKWEPVT